MNREELYKKFGPLLIEAVVLITMDEINTLRTALSLPARTEQQLLDVVSTKLSTLTKYPWMEGVL